MLQLTLTTWVGLDPFFRLILSNRFLLYFYCCHFPISKTMKKTTILLTLSFCSFFIHAQISFETTYHEDGFSLKAANIIETTDGDFLTAYSLAGGWDLMGLGKVSEQGEWLEQYQYGSGSSYALNGLALQPLSNGEYLLIADSIDCPWIMCNRNKNLYRVNPQGNILNNSTLSISSNSMFHKHQLIDDEILTILTRGITLLPSLSAFSLDGDSLWSVTYTLPPGQGSLDLKCFTSLQSGGFMLAGKMNNGNRLIMMRTDAEGDSLWTKINGVMFDTYEAKDIIETADQSIYLIGDTSAISAQTDIHLTKTDSQGNILWCKKFGGNDYDRAVSFEQLADGSFVILGNTFSFGAGGSDYYLIKTDVDGNVLWTNTFGTNQNEVAVSLLATQDGGFIVSGERETNNSDEQDLYIVKVNDQGNLVEIQNSHETPAFSFYPNPANNYITFESDKRITSLSYTDMCGRISLQQQNEFNISRSDISTLPSGIYTCKISFVDGHQTTRSVVISR